MNTKLTKLNLIISKIKRRLAQDDIQVMIGHFDRNYYITNYGLTDNAGSPEKHYHKEGWRRGANPAPWFSTQYYLNKNQDVRDAGINPFVHYLVYGRKEGRSIAPAHSAVSAESHAAPSAHSSAEADDYAGYRNRDGAGSTGDAGPGGEKNRDIEILGRAMDVTFYAAQAPEIDFTTVSPGFHYATVGWKAGLDPSPTFSTTRYLALHQDVASAGMNPFLHFLLNGQSEGRTILPSHRTGNTAVLADGRSEWSGYTEVQQRGLANLESRQPDPELISFALSLAGNNLVKEVNAFSLKQDGGKPLVSVIIPCLRQDLLTVECIKSFAVNTGDVDIEIIVADNASGGSVFEALSHNEHVKYLRFDHNMGFGPACNAAAEASSGEYLFIFNNDAQVGPKCISAMLEVFADDPLTGAVGPKILNFDGSLQEAGATIKPDGTGQLIGYGLDPNIPRFNYRREVDYVSGAALMVRRKLFLELGGFDGVYAPAYFEDVDICFRIREAGYKIYYEPTARVAHHLSKTSNSSDAGLATKMELVNRNKATFVKRWVKQLSESRLRTIAFYLPQYHPTPQNDVWWGKGFTEWANTSKAQPNFKGHRQPRMPADLGFYDLRVAEVMDQQAALAKKYGVDGFCYYYYWFSGKRVLEFPLERLLKTGKPDIPFCLCWANENWTRRWDGREEDVLLKQSYTDDCAVSIAEDIGRYFELPQYICIDGKPLILIYRIDEIPNPMRFMTSLRNVWRTQGKGEVVIAMVESFALSAAPKDPKPFGADITVEFPAHGMVNDPPIPVVKLNPEWRGSAHDYRELAANFMTRREPGFKRIRSVLVGWDNTARHTDRSLVLQNATPGAFQAWLEWTYERTRLQNFGDERMVFINAWNEWGEGSYLEPDTVYGHGHLEAVRNAREAVDLGGHIFEE